MSRPRRRAPPVTNTVLPLTVSPVWSISMPPIVPFAACPTSPALLLNCARMAEPRQVVVYSRKGCHLCEVVKESLTKLARQGGFTWREIDVDSDDDLRRRFTDEVPVVFIDGRKAFKYRLDESEF